MKKLTFIIRSIYTWASMTTFVLAMLVLYPIMVWPISLFGEKGRRLSHAGYRMWGHVFYLFGIRYLVFGEANLLWNGPLLLTSNHNSFLDSPAAFVAIKRPIKALAKADLAKLPVFGTVIKTATVLVDRSKASSRSASLIAIARELKQERAVLLFPEGRMNPGPDPLLPFQIGAFQLAYRLGTPVQPICQKNTRYMLPPSGDFLMRPGVIEIHIGKALYPKEYESAEALMEACREFMLGKLSYE